MQTRNETFVNLPKNTDSQEVFLDMKSPESSEYDLELDMLTEDQMPIPENIEDDDIVPEPKTYELKNTLKKIQQKK